MTAPPLTHHEIVGLVEPFARQGRHVDLGATDRASRRIVFKPRDVPAEPSGAPAWRETLELDCRSEGRFVLLRTLVGPGGASASLLANGPEPGALQARIDAVPPARHFSVGAAYLVTRSYDTALPSGVRAGRETGAATLVLTHAQLQVDGLMLALAIKLPGLRSVAADLTLATAPGLGPELPEDLLAVLGWDWARLIRTKEGWSSKLRLRGAVLRRSRTAEAALERAGAHLARVLAEPPEKFHDRHRLARWGVVARRGIPSLTALSMVVGALLLPRLTDPANSGLWMALHYAPIGLLALSFSLQELPQFEIPPWPRRSRAERWTAGPAAESEAAR
ncbi:MAG TPA: hypothetical protein VET87_19840 [Rubrivivax sp.]|nr:hypothetical protein [Rubrivivax sp.]